MNLQDLHKPFPANAIHWRVGSTDKSKTRGLALAYLDARNVMERLDDVCGQENWQDSYTETPTGRVLCTISINVDGKWVAKSDGAGNTDIEGDKGGISDAFKRAAVKWGIGRYLYALDSPWVAVETYGKSSKIKDTEYEKLAKVLNGGKVPDTKPKQASRDDFEAFTNGLREQGDLDCLDDFWTGKSDELEAMPADWRATLFITFMEQGCSIAESLDGLQAFWKAYFTGVKALDAEDKDALTGKKDKAKERLTGPLANGNSNHILTPLDAG